MIGNFIASIYRLLDHKMKQTPTPKTKFKLEIDVYFSSTNDLLEKLNTVVEEISTGNLNYEMGCTKYDIQSTQQIKETKCNVLYTEEPKFRFEEINGIECIVYQSKMNFKQEL